MKLSFLVLVIVLLALSVESKKKDRKVSPKSKKEEIKPVQSNQNNTVEEVDIYKIKEG